MTHADQNQIESGFFCQSHIYFDDKFDLKMAYFYLDYVSTFNSQCQNYQQSLLINKIRLQNLKNTTQEMTRYLFLSIYFYKQFQISNSFLQFTNTSKLNNRNVEYNFVDLKKLKNQCKSSFAKAKRYGRLCGLCDTLMFGVR